MRMKLETEVMRQEAREERNQRRLEKLLRFFAVGLSFVSGMTFMVMVTQPDAHGAGAIFAISFVGAVACWAVGEPR